MILAIALVIVLGTVAGALAFGRRATADMTSWAVGGRRRFAGGRRNRTG